MLFLIFSMRRARLILHYHLHWNSQRNSTCLSTFAHHKHTAAEASLCGQARSNLGRVQQHQIASPEILLVSGTCQQQRTRSQCQTEGHPSSCREDNALPLSKPRSSVKLSALKPGRKQRLKGNVSVNESAECHSGSVKVCASTRGPCSKDNANTFECMPHSSELSPTNGGGKELNLDRSELSGSGASETLCTCKGGLLASISPNPSGLADQKCCSQPLLRAAEISEGFELLRKTELLEKLSPKGAASLLEIGVIIRCSFEQLEAVIGLLRNYLLSDERVVKVLVKSKTILVHPVGLLQRKLKLLAFYQIEKETLDRLSSYSSVLSMSIESLEEKLALFEEIGLSTEAKNKVLRAGPGILSMSVQNTIKTVNFLKSIGATRERLSALVRTQPFVLCMSYDNNLLMKYKCLQEIGICAEKIPLVLAFSSRSTMDSIKASMQTFKDMGFSVDDVCLILQKQPSIVGRSSKTLKLTVDYLVYEMGWSNADIVCCPRCLALGLQSRIIPRCNLAVEHGLFEVYTLGTILSYSDSKFMELLRSKRLARK